VSPQIDRTGPTRVPGCTSSRQWRDVRARGPSGGGFFFDTTIWSFHRPRTDNGEMSFIFLQMEKIYFTSLSSEV
jgi:hypothetical protein